MKISKPSFSKIQKDFLEKFNWCLKTDYKGEQLALSKRIGCDQSSASRWANKETAPPDYVCHLLLKELGADSFKVSFGHRIQYLREKIFKISLREFAWAFKLDSISLVEDIERGEAEMPRPCIEMLMRDYWVKASYLDYGDRSIFGYIPHNTESIMARLKEGFRLYIVTSRPGGEGRSWLTCRFVLHRNREHLPQCVVTSGDGSFKSTGGGQLMIEYALHALMQAVQRSLIDFPSILMAESKEWKELCDHRFYQKQISFGAGCADVECEEILQKMIKTEQKRFDSHEEFVKAHKESKNKKS